MIAALGMLGAAVGSAIIVGAIAVGAAAQAVEPAQAPGPTIAGVTVWAWDLGDRLTRRPTLADGQTPNVYFVAGAIELEDGVGEGPHRLTDGFAGEVRGWLLVDAPGAYGFRVECDDGAAVFIGDGTNPVADTEAAGGPDQFTAEGSVTLDPGLHALRVPFYEDRGGFRLRLLWRPPGSTGWKLVPPDALRTEPGQTFAVSPGPKRWFYGDDPRRPGDGRPLADGAEGVHPSMALENFRGPDFRPAVGGMCFMPDGRLAICTWDQRGAVYLIRTPGAGERASGNGGSAAPAVTKFADGLGEPLGIAWVDGALLVTQKQEVTRLVDTDGDGVCDRYEAVAGGWPASHNYHEFSFNLVPLDGRLYVTSSVPLKSGVTMYMLDCATGSAASGGGGGRNFAVSDGPGSLWRIDPATGEMAAIAGGLRAPNGMGIGFNGGLYCCDNQGAWLPASRMNLMREGGFYGHQLAPTGGRASDPAMAWFPHGEIGNSPSEPVLIPDGPYRGQMLVGDVTYGGIQRVQVEQTPTGAQGCVFRFSQGLEAGVNRLAWGPDGCLYVGMIGSNGNWNHKERKFGLQRLRPRDGWADRHTPFEMLRVRARVDGLLITFTAPVEGIAAIDPAAFDVRSWRYIPTIDYGGPKHDARTHPVGQALHSPDGRQVFLRVDGLEEPGPNEGIVVYVRLKGVRAADGREPWSTEAWATVNRLGSASAVLFDPPPDRPPAADPPPGALVLIGSGDEATRQLRRLDGSAPHWRLNALGELEVSLSGGGINAGDLVSREKFGDCFVHIEWLSPAGGDRKKQTNGNSGIKLQSRYEVQIMNTPGAGDGSPPRFNEAGAIYRQRPPDRNASLGAGVWQTYEIRFRAPRWDGERKVANARMSLWWNGVLVHDDVEVKDKTGASPTEAPGEHPLLLQAHDSRAIGPVRFRNVWVVRE